MASKYVVTFLLAITLVRAFNICDDEPFCYNIRNRDIGNSTFVFSDSFESSTSALRAQLTNREDRKIYEISIIALVDDVFRITIDDPNGRRHSVPDALDGVPVPALMLFYVDEQNNLSVGNGESLIEIQRDPFKLEVYRNRSLITVINGLGKLTIKSDVDDRSIGVDFSFPGVTHAYGIPQHAEPLSLRTTQPGGLNPYRLYNSDYCCYPIGTQEALYGSIPVLYAHGTSTTSGVFWLNSAQTFVDINKAGDRVDALFMSETGVVDIFILPGPTLADSVKQYTRLTGPAPLPQYFTLGHHQSRWSYMSQEDAETVVKEFDNHDFALDVIWLDIDYTDSFKYFTWNYDTFPDPIGMQEFVNSTGRKMVVIIDPHYKVQDGYFVYETAKANDYFVKYANGTDYIASCWPGLSSWLDFFKPEAADYYSSLFAMDKFPDGTDILYIWNDMNEPAVFDVFEKTMPRDLVHYGDWEHRDVHNMYGFTQHRATHKGLLARYDNKKRPFVLTRAHFIGSQRYTAVWTGDNVASWEHLRISFPMCLTEALAGISFCGADVGGFVGEVTEELFQRWYQAGAWLPFFRAHSASDVSRREPYLYPEDVQARFRNAIRERYFHLPLWYTVFYEHERFGEPVIRPISYHYSSDPNTLEIDDEWLVGKNVLVHPVAEEGASRIQVYLPGGFDELWFDVSNNLMYMGAGYYAVDVDMDDIPVFYRGGSILPRRNTPRASSEFTHNDPFTIYVFLDINHEATGTIYIDDYESFNYRNKQYAYFQLEYKNNELNTIKIDQDAEFGGAPVISSIIIYRPPTDMNEAVLSTGCSSRSLNVIYGPENSYLTIYDLNVEINEDLKLKLM